MQTKTPVLLIVFVEGEKLRWSVASIGLDSSVVTPLLRSEDGDLATYLELDFDEQVSFLRHRFCGVVQRGCDRLWPKGEKACQFVFLFAGALPNAPEELTQRMAEHFAEWMLRPPVVVFTSAIGFTGTASSTLSRLAGVLDPSIEDALHAGLVPLFSTMADPSAWEISHRQRTWRPSDDRGG